MKKLAMVLAVALGLGVFGGSVATAESVCTDGGDCVTVGEGGYLVVLDGNDSNDGAAAGFISVSDGGQVCADDNGGPDDGNPDNGDESESPTCAP